MMKKLAIITGVTGDVGLAYFNYYSKKSDISCYGVTRQEVTNPNWVQADLEDKEQTKTAIESIPLFGIEEIILIHPVGKFKFEDCNTNIIDKDNDGVDDEVYSSNINTFRNVLEPIYNNLNGKSLTIVQFGSISDKYNIPFWKSYSHSKNVLRAMLEEMSQKPNISGLVLNLSSVKTKAEQKTRPYANARYWVTVDEIVNRSIAQIENNKGYNELCIYNESPDYHENYFKDLDKLYEKWQREMGKDPSQQL